jgi:hypothetical protein
MSPNQGGTCSGQSATSKPETKLDRLGRERDMPKALVEVNVVDCMIASSVL